jgi:hypothetical protein
MTTAQTIRAEFPGWQVWYGVSGHFYARRMLSSPPVVLRAETMDDLRNRVKEYLASDERP